MLIKEGQICLFISFSFLLTYFNYTGSKTEMKKYNIKGQNEKKKIFANLKVISFQSAVTRSELGNKMCLLTRSILARKDKKT